MSEEINQAPTEGEAAPPVEEEQNRPVVDGTPLECGWTFWFDKKNSKNLPSEYQENLKKIGTFYSIEEFWRYYMHLCRPNDLPKDSNYHLFREKNVPMWESFPAGGCWILKVKKRAGILARLWEQLCIACVGESFEEPDVVGVALSIRSKEDVLSIWLRDSSNRTAQIKVGEKLKEVLDLGDGTALEYKNHSTSMKDKSTFRNTKAYVFAAMGAEVYPKVGEAPGASAQAASKDE